MTDHPQSRWTHPLCDDCWTVVQPDREPVRIRMRHRRAEPCCGCGREQLSGIFVRRAPGVLPFCAVKP